ncbi:MAG: hypothetical protein WC781_00745 [Candidatus Pacearchaeota archaeon]|jgi:hypothetical protein
MQQKIKTLSEYFLGTEIIKDYQRDKAFYKEFYEKDNELKDELKRLRKKYFSFIIGGKVIPNIVSIIGLAYWATTKDPHYLCIPFCSEITRNAASSMRKMDNYVELKNKEAIEDYWAYSEKGNFTLDSLINQKEKPKNNNLKRKKEKRKREGDEWKIGTIYENDDDNYESDDEDDE